MRIEDGRKRVVIEDVKPEIDAGRFAIKRTAGERVVVEASAFSDAHDVVACVLLFKPEESLAWSEVPMVLVDQDRWGGEFQVSSLGRWVYTVEAWVDPFLTWRRDLEKKVAAATAARVDLLVGANLLHAASQRAAGADARRLDEAATRLRSDEAAESLATWALDEELQQLAAKYPDKSYASRYVRELAVLVQPERARFSSWYEMFPRSASATPGEHGTFDDCVRRLPYVKSMGFDVLYLPPIHPIGYSYRKGKNNSVAAQPDDVGSPWAIGAPEGGHKSIHPQLGTLEDFRRLVGAAREQGIEVAMDIAFQCSPDHPYVQEHPEWFRHRPDGTIQYAENPPKKYQDIYPFDFETARWRELWEELKSVVEYWIDQGVRIFRVDNPHTKPFSFWEWLIGDVHQEHPDVVFLSEAFTRRKVMYELAKLGFTQSYTYFTWRNTKHELIAYFDELTKTEVADYFRPNLWPNTPDILPEYLHHAGRPAFATRLVLAATLGASYGIYGPAFELMENAPREPGSEEYLNSEKYQIKEWDIDRPDSLRHFIARVNRIRHENPALHYDRGLRFHNVDNDQLLCYSKTDPDQNNLILVVVNLDPHHTHSGWVDVPPEELGVPADRAFQVHDLLSDARFLWQGRHNFVQLDPQLAPAHIFRLRRWIRSERQFEYFL